MKNLFKTIFFLLVLTSITVSAYAQQGFGTNTPAASAVIDMTATNKGVLLPRVALTATNTAGPITSPAANLLVFNTAIAGITPNNVTPGFYCWNGTAWIRLLSVGDNTGGWTLTGNTGTTPGTNFVGSTDAHDLAFRTNATERMRMTSTGNVGVGTTNPDASALLDISSTTQGFLPPRMTSAQMAAIANPVEGLMVYNTTLQCLAYYAKGAFTCAFNAPVMPPVASNVTVNGAMWIGNVLNASYSYSQSEGVAAGTPAYQWYYATASDGSGKTAFSGATSSSYTIAAPAVVGTYVAVGVTPVTAAGTAGVQVLSPWRVVTINTAPYFTSLTNTAGTNEGSLATTIYTATDDDNDPLGTPTYQWYRFTDASGNGKNAIAGATAATYTFTTDDVGYYIKAGATATATSGKTPGTEQMASAYVGPVVSCGGTMIVTHTAGAVAPVTKTVTYGTVYTNIGGNGYQCWITQNLGADNSPTSNTDYTEASAGWYWRYNQARGYMVASTGTRTPAGAWAITGVDGTLGWSSGNDPCTLLLGNDWHMPSSAAWTAVLGVYQHTGPVTPILNLGASGYVTWEGYLYRLNPPENQTQGMYWSTTGSSSSGIGQSYQYFWSSMNMRYENLLTEWNTSYGATVRCLK
jgi:hypothetical protein